MHSARAHKADTHTLVCIHNKSPDIVCAVWFVIFFFVVRGSRASHTVRHSLNNSKLSVYAPALVHSLMHFAYSIFASRMEIDGFLSVCVKCIYILCLHSGARTTQRIFYFIWRRWWCCWWAANIFHLRTAIALARTQQNILPMDDLRWIHNLHTNNFGSY